MEVIFLACNHDRHTDDRYIAFTNGDSAIAQCKKWMEHWKEQVEENNQYGDYCLYISDDYYSFVEAIKLEKT